MQLSAKKNKLQAQTLQEAFAHATQYVKKIHKDRKR